MTLPLKIIVRMPNWIGDFVMATPVLADLRKTFPHAHITAMCTTSSCGLLKENPHINDIFSFSKPSSSKEISLILKKIMQGNYDLGILLTHSFSSAWWFLRGKVKRRIGYSSHFRRLLLTDAVSFSSNLQEQHLVITYKMVLAPLNIPISNTAPALYLTKEELEKTFLQLQAKGIQKDDFLIGINPGASYGSAKCWLPERFAEVTKELLKKKNTKILYFGSEQASSLVKEICDKISSENVINLAGLTSIRELCLSISMCRVLLTNDSGPMHIASALQTPLVALFGSTNDAVTGPYQSGIVIHKHVECSPCYRRVCPIDFRCMKQIKSEEVLEEIKGLIAKYESLCV